MKISVYEAVSALGMVAGVTKDKVMRAIIRRFEQAPFEIKDNPAAAYGREFKAAAIDDYVTFYSGKTAQDHELEFSLGDLTAKADCLTEDGLPVFVYAPYSMRDNDMLKFKKLAQRLDVFARIQLSLFVMDKQEGVFFQWWPASSCSEKVQIDMDYIEALLPRIDQFLDELASEDVGPHLKPLKVTIDTQEAQMLIDEYDQLKIAIDNAGERQKEIIAELQALTNNEPAIICGRSLNKVTRQGAIDYKKIAEEFAKDVDVEKYRKGGSEFWQFR